MREWIDKTWRVMAARGWQVGKLREVRQRAHTSRYELDNFGHLMLSLGMTVSNIVLYS